jgi:hypothetical protein
MIAKTFRSFFGVKPFAIKEKLLSGREKHNRDGFGSLKRRLICLRTCCRRSGWPGQIRAGRAAAGVCGVLHNWCSDYTHCNAQLLESLVS